VVSGTILHRQHSQQRAREKVFMATVVHSPEQTTQRVILRHVSWETYERLLSEHEQCSSPRFTYDRGVLEIMSPSIKHERLNRSLATLCEVIAEELHIELDNAGSTTFKREDLARGFEPDSCFYVQNVERVRERDQIDLTVDPPPDLVIEIDISRSSLDRFPIFANIGVPEVWRYDGTLLTTFALQAGTYQIVAASAVFPGVTSQILSQFMAESKTMPHTVWLRRVRAWARRQRRGGTRRSSLYA
jgi:Uma2 family endonuclease